MVATGSLEGIINILDASTNQIISTPQSSGDYITDLEWSPTGEQLVTASFQGLVQLWDVNSETLLWATDVYGENLIDGLVSIRWNSDNSKLAVAAQYGGATILNALDGSIAFRIASGETYDVEWSADDTYIITMAITGMNTWDTTNGNLVQAFPTDFTIGFPTGIMINHAETILAVVYGKVDATTYPSTISTTVNFVNSNNLTIINTITSSEILLNSILGLQWSPDDVYWAASSYDGILQVWDATTGTLIIVLEADSPLYDFDWLDNTSLIYASHEDGLVTINISPITVPLRENSAQ
jgi:WD40 repeat protein